jgi:chorismate mutase
MNTPYYDLSLIAARLEGLEETIVFKLIDRAQFCANLCVYEPGKISFSGDTSHSLFEIRMYHQELMDAQFGRFCVPEERPFTKGLPIPQRTVTLPDSRLHLSDFELISQTEDILKSYLELIPKICPPGDDSQYGSSVEDDVYALQSIARRIHVGALYIAESKYTGDHEVYKQFIKDGNTDALMSELTRKEVEDAVVERIRQKTISTQSTVNRSVRNVVDPDVIAEYYRDWIIPLTKKGEITYLTHRQYV